MQHLHAMSLELHDIPPTPRRAHWGAACAVRWPILLAGLVLTVYGGLVTLMLFFASHAGAPRVETELDQRHEVVTGQVTEAVPLAANRHGTLVDRVRFRYPTPDGQPIEGLCFAPRGRYSPGEQAVVELLPEPPFHARLQDGHLSFTTGLVAPAFALTIVPGVLLLAAWALCAMRTRRLLACGDATVAEVLDVAQVRFVTPAMLAVRFRFRDRNARTREGRQWVRERSPLGQRLKSGAARLVLVQERDHPTRHRLTRPGDFRTSPSRSAELSNLAERG